VRRPQIAVAGEDREENLWPFSLFRRRPPIRDTAELADFIDQNSAFLVQKGIYEYARARAGHYAKVLFRESQFLEAVEVSRWTAYPLGLAMVAELVEGVLRPRDAGDRIRVQDAIHSVALSVLDRYGAPVPLGEQAWSAARAELSQRLRVIGLHPPKLAKDIPEPYVQAYFDLMPIHEKLRAQDFPTTRNYLRVALCNIHDEFSERLDAPAVLESLMAHPS
jgi:hypothetical protein